MILVQKEEVRPVFMLVPEKYAGCKDMAPEGCKSRLYVGLIPAIK